MNAFIRKIDSMVQLSDGKRRVLARLTDRSKLFGPREHVIEADEQSGAVNILLSGWACRCKVLPNGQRQITSLLLPGDMCDPHGFLVRTTDHLLYTLTHATLAKVPGNVIRDLATSGSELAEVLWLQMLEAAEIQREWLLSLGKRDATERLAHLYCEIITRLDATGQSIRIHYDMPITQAEVADIMGVSAVQVNRSLAELRAKGLIALRNKRLTILNRQALIDFAMFNPTYLHRRAA